MATEFTRLIRRACAALGAAVVLAALVASPTARAQDLAQDTNEGTVTVTLLHNNDGESKLLPDAEAGFPGIARFSQALQELGTGTEADILLRVTSGDNFLASKEFSAGLAQSEALFDSVALSGLYEAMGLGNHDFDFGPDVTARFIEGFEPMVPFLAANVDVSGEPALATLADAGRIAPSTIITDPMSGLDVGVIGALTPRLANISSPGAVRVSSGVAEAVNAEAERLGAAGVHRVVLLSHLQGLSADRDLVPQLRGVDVVVAGGGDELLKNSGDTCLPDAEAEGPYPLVLIDADDREVPVVTAPGGYRCIGQLDLVFDAGGYLVEWSGTSIGVPVDGPAEAYAVERVESPLTQALAELESTVLATSEVDLDGRRSAVRTGSTNVGELLASALLYSAPDADVAVQNGGGIRNDSIIGAGEITVADTFDIAPFSNFVVSVDVPRDRFKDLLEVAVAGLPEAEGTFPQIAGFTIEVDPTAAPRQVNRDGDCTLTGSAGDRVRTVTLDDGTEIVRDGQVVSGGPLALATLSFLAEGGDCYPLDDLEATNHGRSYQQALADYLTVGLDGTIDDQRWPGAGSRISIGQVADADVDEDEPEAEPEATEDEPKPEAEPEATDDEPDDALAETGLDSWYWGIISATIAAGGLMVWLEARRSALRSLATRLATTRAWFPDR